jgi:serine-type D-Ala-D-Ala carboxypeptidase/endopeptidase (penicillin-binding protein 4)
MQRCLLSLLASFLLSSSLLHAQTLNERIEKVIGSEDYAQSRWGLLIIDAKTGKPIFERDADKLFTPASTTKLYTCAAALHYLGANHVFETPIHYRGEVKGTTLFGDLILVASGDLTFGGRRGKDGKTKWRNNDHTYANSGLSLAQLTETDPLYAIKELAQAVVDSNLTEVRGEVLVDDRLFPKARSTGSGPDLITPMVINDNLLDLIITPAKKVGDLATGMVQPANDLIHIDFQVVTGAEKTPISINFASPGPDSISVRGSIPIDGPAVVRYVPIEDPAAFVRSMLILELRKRGIRVSAHPTHVGSHELPPKDSYEAKNRIGVYTSEPLSEVIEVTLKVSHNLYASTLPILIANHSKQTASIERGLQMQGKFLKELGLPIEKISFAGGAGGSNADMTTPRATVQLIQSMRKHKAKDAFFAGLPRLGVDGTLAEVLPPDSKAKDQARAKTGTYVWFDSLNGRVLLRSKTLAGTLTTAKGTDLDFAFFVNEVPLPPGIGATREGKVLAKLCELVYEFGP